VVFADTVFLIAYFNRRDHLHEMAERAVEDIEDAMLTTEFVLLEFADACAGRDLRGLFQAAHESLRASYNVEIVGLSSQLFDRGCRLYRSRPDKDWSLTDCTSFVVMEERGLSEALTADHHFEQAGFRALLRD